VDRHVELACMPGTTRERGRWRHRGSAAPTLRAAAWAKAYPRLYLASHYRAPTWRR